MKAQSAYMLIMNIHIVDRCLGYYLHITNVEKASKIESCRRRSATPEYGKARTLHVTKVWNAPPLEPSNGDRKRKGTMNSRI